MDQGGEVSGSAAREDELDFSDPAIKRVSQSFVPEMSQKKLSKEKFMKILSQLDQELQVQILSNYKLVER